MIWGADRPHAHLTEFQSGQAPSTVDPQLLQVHRTMAKAQPGPNFWKVKGTPMMRLSSHRLGSGFRLRSQRAAAWNSRLGRRNQQAPGKLCRTGIVVRQSIWGAVTCQTASWRQTSNDLRSSSDTLGKCTVRRLGRPNARSASECGSVHIL